MLFPWVIMENQSQTFDAYNYKEIHMGQINYKRNFFHNIQKLFNLHDYENIFLKSKSLDSASSYESREIN